MKKQIAAFLYSVLIAVRVSAGSAYDFPTVYYSPSANPTLATQAYTESPPVVSSITKQKQGVVYTGRVGEPIVETASRKTWPKITLAESVPINLTDKNGTAFSFVISGDLVQKAENSRGNFYQAEQKITVKGTTHYLKGGVFVENGTGAQTAFWFPPYDLPAVMVSMKPVDFAKGIYAEEVEAEFRVELLYMGKSKDTIKLAYREFIDDKIRPAFSQEINYDYTGPTEVGHKSFELYVLEATGAKIVYRVVSP